MSDVSPPQDILRRFGVSDPQFVVRTQIATIWRVSLRADTHAALKVYENRDMQNERYGIAYLSEAEGSSAAYVFDSTRSAVLLEWLAGPSLGDLSRSGRDKEAAVELVSVANALHQQQRQTPQDWPRLQSWFAPLFSLQFSADCAPKTRRAMLTARVVAKNLLADDSDPKPLHGDLHHDNVRLGPRGYCAFDAKGVVGARAYELANAFRNPKGMPEAVRDVSRIRFLRDCWSAAFSVDANTLMAWAVAKSALSIAWRCDGVLSDDPEVDLLMRFIFVLHKT